MSNLAEQSAKYKQASKELFQLATKPSSDTENPSRDLAMAIRDVLTEHGFGFSEPISDISQLRACVDDIEIGFRLVNRHFRGKADAILKERIEQLAKCAQRLHTVMKVGPELPPVVSNKETAISYDLLNAIKVWITESEIPES